MAQRAIKRMQTVQGSLLWFLIVFDFILNVPVKFFSYVGTGLPGLNKY